MQAFLRDLRFGSRMLAKSPGFTLAAILTLALGIGANTAIFTVASALLLRPFPYRQPDQLVSLTAKNKTTDLEGTLLRYELVRDRNRSFDAVAAWTNDTFNLTGHGEPLQVQVGRVSANFFSMLGVQPELGRTFTEEEARPEGQAVVMLSDAIWRRRFAGDPNIIGQTITLDTTPHVVVGVVPGNVQFPFMGSSDIWTPRYFELTLIPPQRLRLGVGYLGVVARLRPGVTMASTDSELAVLNRQYREQNPAAPDADPNVVMTVAPLRA